MKFLRDLIPDSWYPGMNIFLISMFIVLIFGGPLSILEVIVHFFFCIGFGIIYRPKIKSKKE